MAYNVEVLTDARCIVGEGPIWDDKNNRLLMVDIQGKRLRSIHFDSWRIEDLVLPQQTGFLLLEENGGVLGGAEDGVYRIDDSGNFKRVSKPCQLKGMRFNDGKIGHDGRAYLGTFSRDYSAAFYRMEIDGTLTELFDGVGNSNGLDWSLDGKTLYYNDTPTKRTDAFDFDAKTGSITNRRKIYEYLVGNPDGMTIDSDGNLWSAVWGSGCILCINPAKGEVVRKIELPVSQVACCAFAGKDMNTLVVTTAAHGVMLKDEPLAGATFVVDVDAKGTKPNRIALKV